MKRNFSIDVIKFVLSIAIFLHHFDLFPGGYLAVEGFFMISGFLMMNSLFRQKKEDRLLPNSTAHFVFHRYSAIFLPLFFSAISGFFINEMLTYPELAKTMPSRISGLLFEVFPVQTLGFQGTYTTGVSWYLAALFFGLAVLHPMAKKDPERFAYTVCPPIILLFYGFLCVYSKHLNLPCEWYFGFVNSGLIRGIAGLCAGCVLFVLVKDSNEKKGVSLFSRIVFSLLSLAGWYFIYYGMAEKDLVHTPHDYIVTAVLFVVLYLELSGKTVLSLLFSHRWTGVLANISRYVFLNHYAWSQYFLIQHSDIKPEKMIFWYLLCIAASSSAVALLTYLTRLAIKGIRKIKNRTGNGTLAA